MVARLATSHGRRIYGIWPDEPAQLGIARLVAGGTRWNMYNHSTWRPGYGTLLSVAYLFTDDPTSVYQAGLILNAVLGGVATVLLYLLARRLTGLGPAPSAIAATLVSLAPALLFTTDYVWSEALVQPLYLAALYVLLRFHDRPSLVTGLGAAALAVAAFGAHSRMLPLAVVVVGVVAVVVWRRRWPWWKGAVTVAWTGAAFAAVSWYSEWVVDRLWEQPFERNSYGGVLSQLRKVDDMFVSVVGQAWSQLVITAGVVGVGVVAAVAAAVRRPLPLADHRRAPAPSVADARIVLAAAGALVALSMLFMTDRWRSDQIVYSRYNDAALAPLVLVGIGALVTVCWSNLLKVLGGTAAATLLGGLVLNALRHDELAARDAVRQMILGLLAFMGRPRGIDVVPISIAAVAVIAGLGLWVVLSRVAGVRSAILLLLGALVLVGYLRADGIVNRNRNGWASLRSVAVLDSGVLPADVGIDYLMKPGSNDTGRMMAFQFYLPDHEFTVITELDLDDPATPFVFAPDDNAALAGAGALIAWHDPSKPIALWVLPGAERDRLLAAGLLEPPEPAGAVGILR